MLGRTSEPALRPAGPSFAPPRVQCIPRSAPSSTLALRRVCDAAGRSASDPPGPSPFSCNCACCVAGEAKSALLASAELRMSTHGTRTAHGDATAGGASPGKSSWPSGPMRSGGAAGSHMLPLLRSGQGMSMLARRVRRSPMGGRFRWAWWRSWGVEEAASRDRAPSPSLPPLPLAATPTAGVLRLLRRPDGASVLAPCREPPPMSQGTPPPGAPSSPTALSAAFASAIFSDTLSTGTRLSTCLAFSNAPSPPLAVPRLPPRA
mmetsp:Transcript_20768/g.62097  ORF Transcript_20768/g.62097 Transcript_20768/m.62097 type:complete len:263 (-) Transcript_20768:3228-4016(-)